LRWASRCITIRKVQEAIQELRLAGHPIVTSGNGVRLAPWAIDVEMCADALRRRLAHQYLTLRAMRATARRMRDQEAAALHATLWDLTPFGVVTA
jgi:methylthioribose-1-phosphate isomerase